MDRYLEHRRVGGSLIMVILLLLAICGQASQAQLHSWQRIEYPALEDAGRDGEPITILVSSGGRLGEASHLRFSLLWTAPPGGNPSKTIADAADVVVQLHYADGAIEKPKEDRAPDWSGAGNQRAMTYNLSWVLPWGPNRLDEGWIELRTKRRTWWIEVPYGFTRDPSDPLPAVDRGGGAPELPPTLKSMGEGDLLVPWLAVTYDLGKLRDNGRLTVRMANPLDAEAECILYRDDGRVGESIYLWDLHSPRTSMRIEHTSGILEAHPMGIRLHKDGMRRSDTYQFNRFPAEQRDWAKAVVTVGDTPYSFIVPSSLFKYVHGIADPGNRRRVARPRVP